MNGTSLSVIKRQTVKLMMDPNSLVRTSYCFGIHVRAHTISSNMKHVYTNASIATRDEDTDNTPVLLLLLEMRTPVSLCFALLTHSPPFLICLTLLDNTPTGSSPPTIVHR